MFAQAPPVQIPVIDPNAALQQAAQQGAVVWFAAFVLTFFGFLIVAGVYFIVYPWSKRSMELMNQTAMTLTVVTDSQRKQMEMMTGLDVTSKDTSGKVDRLIRTSSVYRDIIRKLASSSSVNIDAELGRLAEIGEPGGSQLFRTVSN